MAADSATPDHATKFPQLMERARAGSDGAARQLVEQHGSFVLRTVRRRLPRRLRSKYDSVDLAQEVWATFFSDSLAHYRFGSAAELNHFLWQLADWRSRDLIRDLCFRAKTNIGREHGLDSSTVRTEVQGKPDGAPPPTAQATAADEWDRLINGENPRNQDILLLLRQGKTYQEVARKLGVSLRTVR
ncbi:MAG TPA: helix-turn-helix domain-containing protein, partial [Gemmataceae bacterium]|nr:helix-turn-helix domain-containing protein [Gemmataceae bacterium]